MCQTQIERQQSHSFFFSYFFSSINLWRFVCFFPSFVCISSHLESKRNTLNDFDFGQIVRLVICPSRSSSHVLQTVFASSALGPKRCSAFRIRPNIGMLCSTIVSFRLTDFATLLPARDFDSDCSLFPSSTLNKGYSLFVVYIQIDRPKSALLRCAASSNAFSIGVTFWPTDLPDSKDVSCSVGSESRQK